MLMMAAPPAARLRSRLLPFVGIWAFACLMLLAFSGPAFQTGIFPDPDDALRLQQVRDWLGGQSWFDVTQYRMNAPQGGPMHWSRLVDVPIAAVILLLRPLIGSPGAETAALIMVPLVTLGLVMALVALLARLLLGRERALLACLLTPVSVLAVAQLRPFRVDHHGWQLALALGVVCALLDPRSRRSGLLAGAAAALWLTISIEALPFVAGAAALLGLRWMQDPQEGDRLKSFAQSLAGSSLLLLVATQRSAYWAATACDALTLPYLGAFAVAAAGLAALTTLPPRTKLPRAAMLLCVAAAAAATVAAIAPACSRGPFQALDPIVSSFWYQHVAEGLPIWRQEPAIIAYMICFPIVGLAGSVVARRRAAGVQRANWLAMIWLLAVAILISLAVQRGAALANLLALPGGVYLFDRALVRTRKFALPLRLPALLAAMLLIVPGFAVGALLPKPREPAPAAAIATRQCVDARELALLDRLPPARIAAPLDIGPAVLVHSRHEIIASGHHRNAAAMRDVIDIFTLPPDVARARLARRGVAFLLVCPDLVEPQLYAERGPAGLWAQLDRGRTPAWLEPVRWPGQSSLRLWRIR